MSAPFGSNAEDSTPNPSVKSDRKFRRLRNEISERRWAARMISVLWPGPSVEQIAYAACQPLQRDTRTIRRILDGTTKRVDGGVLALLCAYFRASGIDPMQYLETP